MYLSLIIGRWSTRFRTSALIYVRLRPLLYDSSTPTYPFCPGLFGFGLYDVIYHFVPTLGLRWFGSGSV